MNKNKAKIQRKEGENMKSSSTNEINKGMQGIDNITFEVNMPKYLSNISQMSLYNKSGRKYGEMTPNKNNNKITISLTIPHYFRNDNTVPFGIQEFSSINVFYNDCIKQLKPKIGDISKSEIVLKSIECNITDYVSDNAKISDVLNFLCKAFLNYEFDNLKYVGASKKCIYKEETHTLIAKKEKYYVFKAYDKTKEQERKGRKHIAEGLLRVEIKLVDRELKKLLKKLFGKKAIFLSDVLNPKSLKKVVERYNQIFCDDVIAEKVQTMVKEISGLLFYSLSDTNKLAITIANEKEIIVDVSILAQAYRKFLKSWGIADHTARDIRNQTAKVDLPTDVIKTIEKFKDICR